MQRQIRRLTALGVLVAVALTTLMLLTCHQRPYRIVTGMPLTAQRCDNKVSLKQRVDGVGVGNSTLHCQKKERRKVCEKLLGLGSLVIPNDLQEECEAITEESPDWLELFKRFLWYVQWHRDVYDRIAKNLTTLQETRTLTFNCDIFKRCTGLGATVRSIATGVLAAMVLALGRLKRKAAPGRDGLSAEMVCCDVLVDFWFCLFNWCWRNGMVPSEWRKNVIVPVPKKRRKGTCKMDDFRGIALGSVVYKVMCSIVQQRMTQMVEEKQLLAEEQGGFRKGRGCRDQVLTLTLLGQIKAMSKRGMFAAFIDFRKAYDRVDRAKLWQCLEGMGFSGRVTDFIRATYKDLSGEVKVGEMLSEPFGMTCGLRQGCVLSPLLFSLYINSLVEKLKAAGVGVECRGRLVSALLYADDAVLFAEDEEGMRVSLGVLSEWCKQWAVEINVDKCGVMHMRRRGVKRTGEKFHVDSKRIEVVEEYKYLGCVINEQLGSRRMVEERAKAGARALSEWLRKCRVAVGEVRGETFVKLMEMLVGSVLMYGAEVWGGGGQLGPVEGVQMRAARIFLGVGRLHPLVSLQYELNMVPLRWEGMRRCIEFWVMVLRLNEERLLKVVMLETLEKGCKIKWVQNLKKCLEMFGWDGVSVEDLRGLSMGEVRKVLMDVVWREVRGEWKKEAQRRPKLEIIGRLIEKECEGRCMMVKCKRRRRWLMKLRGGTAELGVETGRWHGVRREERICKNCRSGEVEDVKHVVMRCTYVEEEREKLEELMNGRVEGWQGMDGNVRVMVIMDRACRDEAVGRAVERIWLRRFTTHGSHP